MTAQKKIEGHSKPSQKIREFSENTNLSTSIKLLRFSPKINNNNNKQSTQAENKSYKNNNKKQSNKNICPFACPNCQSLGGELVKSKYEIVNILSDNSDSVFSPMHEQYHDDEDHKSAIRNDSGKIFLSADLVVDSFFQQKYKK
jgi:hypothetical protein